MKSCQKVGIFHFQSQFWRPKMTLIFLKMVFSSKITLVEQLLLKSFQILPILQKFYLVKLCPIFGSSQSLAP